MKIGENDIGSIIITDEENGVIAVISDNELIIHDGFKATFNDDES